MDIKEIIRKILQQFPVIYFGTMICTFIYCLIFAPDSQFAVSYFAEMMILSLMGAAPSLVFYSKHELTEEEWSVRRVIHIILLEGIILTLGRYYGLYHTFWQGVFFAFLVLLVYVIVYISVFRFDCKTADRMNQKIRERKQNAKVE